MSPDVVYSQGWETPPADWRQMRDQAVRAALQEREKLKVEAVEARARAKERMAKKGRAGWPALGAAMMSSSSVQHLLQWQQLNQPMRKQMQPLL
jgi:hypothetical protein